MQATHKVKRQAVKLVEGGKTIKLVTDDETQALQEG